MDWLSMNRGILQGSCSLLGWEESDRYITHPSCLESLKAMETELIHEDIVTRNVQRSLGLSRTIQKDLLPILINNQDQSLVASVVRVLANLTMPAECLLPTQLASCSQSARESVWQLQLLLLNAKRAFLDDRATVAIIQSIRDTLHYSNGDKRLSEEECLHISNALILIRNILHMPDRLDASTSSTTAQNFDELQSLQNKLIWNFFAQGLDIVILLLINNKYRVFWTVAVVQLIALLFKDQRVDKIQKLLALASDISDSSEDDVDSDTSKHSVLESGSGQSSCDSGKSLPTPSASDSGYGLQSENWSSCDGASLSRSSTPYHPPLINRNSPFSSLNSSFDESDRSPCLPTRHCNDSLMCTKNGRRCSKPNCKYDNSIQDSANIDDDNCNDFKLIKSKSKIMDEDMITSDLEQTISLSPLSSSDEELKHLFSLDSVKVRLEVHKHKHQHWPSKKNNESDSSNDDDEANQIIKTRSHPPIGWKCKGVGDVKYQSCSSWICLDAALEMAASRGRSASTKEALLEKRRKMRLVAGHLAHTPTDDDISNLLKDFTLSFLHNGFSDLIMDLKGVMTVNSSMILDKTHFLWMLTYFLRLANTTSLGHYHVSCILSSDVISYLVYEGVVMQEELELIFRSSHADPQPLLRRLHLLVMALREVFSTIGDYCKKSVTKKEKESFQRLRVKIAEMVDVRQLMLLLIRNFNSFTQSKQYLIDIISTNHLLLLLLESVYIDPDTCQQLDLPAHITQFATLKVMEQYGTVLEDFKINSEFVNDCVFTMMHHVVGEGKATHVLFQPIILRTFCKILEEEAHVSEIWEDLMNFTLSEFKRAAERSPQTCVQKLFGQMTVNSDCGHDSLGPGVSGTSGCNASECSDGSLSPDDAALLLDDSLYWWYLQFQHHPDVIGSIQEGMTEIQKFRTRIQVLQDLLSQGIVSQAEYENLKDKEVDKMDDDRHDSKNVKSIMLPLSERDNVFQLIRDLISSGFKMQIDWLQRVLLEACYVKAGLGLSEDEPPPDPVLYYSHLMNQSLPLVPYNEALELSLQNPKFLELLHTLGFHLPGDVGKVFPRIPSFWNVDVLYSISLRLGPPLQQRLKFKLSCLEDWLQQSHCDSDEVMIEEDDGFQLSPPRKTSLSEFPNNSHSHLYKAYAIGTRFELTTHSSSLLLAKSNQETNERRQSIPLGSRLFPVCPKPFVHHQRRESVPENLMYGSNRNLPIIPPFGPPRTKALLNATNACGPLGSNL